MYTIGIVKKLLLVVLVFSLIYVVSSALLIKGGFSLEKMRVSDSFTEEELWQHQQPEQNDYHLFLAEIESKEIFAFPLIEEKSVSSAPKIDPKEINEIIDNLRLVGIMPGNPSQVIIEDKKKRKTFYLKEGESFSDDVIIEKIGENSVVLSCYGESFELYFYNTSSNTD